MHYHLLIVAILALNAVEAIVVVRRTIAVAFPSVALKGILVARI